MSETDDTSRHGEILKASSPGLDQIEVGMDVLGIDGEHVGRVKELAKDAFLIDRPLAHDLWAPFASVVEAGEQGGAFRRGPHQPNAVILNISSEHIDNQGWKHA